MSHQTQHNNKIEKGKHDNCADCQRQKRQNTALISIYQRLQSVRGKSKLVKDSLDFHLTQSFTISNKVKDLENQCRGAPDRLYSVQQVKDLGFTIASRVFENKMKNKAQQQNAKLRQTIKKLQKQRNLRLNERSLRQMMKNTPNQTTYNAVDNLGNSTFESINLRSGNSSRESHINRISITRGSHLNAVVDNLWKDICSTKSSDFRQPKSRQIKQQPDQQQEQPNYEMLKSSLWLYESQKNTKLQQQLLDTSMPKRYQISRPLKRGLILPAVKVPK